ncbi:2-octaprenyl-6-methoxyphenyl hydroxylase [Psychromonas sp. Urea-02u-13]|uniref:2-octaprenyl-6-methoxyphenyl hydroxylase n=1 Tax=Psychromonas sp. Urea-02u-13 TaxID=2058326 RepID=UPI000C3473EC|nr:2-octaprenyl-6-methoxyphenyl hydroxylase [Psychromonas sp. Urea-02u-13]PKG39478.1 2-octaprenyl-6-methoxyphenyl hydroxylase [Psychromonas sp. Urea-02u-13]
MANQNSAQADTTIEADIVIVGAGMSGCLLALAIIKQSPALKIVLIDDNPERLDKGAHPGFDARSIALSAGSCGLLDNLGLWAALKQNAQPIDDIHISDRGNLGIVNLEKTASNLPFGAVVELQNVGQVLQQQLARFPQIKRFYNSALINIEKQTQTVICELQNKQIIEAKLCVAADGANSKTNQLLSISAAQSDYQCSAVITNVSADKAHMNRAYERFTDAGPLALLPLSNNRYSLVWSVKNSELPALLALDEHAFLAKLQQAFGYRAGIFTKAGQRHSYPLKLIKSDKPITHRGVAIGNAAHCLHPVMGQGFNLGMRDISVLAKIITEIDDVNQLGGYAMLECYWQARKKDHQRTITMTDSIVRIFSNPHLPFVFGRTIALQAIACIPSLSAPIVKQAKGQFNLFTQEEKS